MPRWFRGGLPIAVVRDGVLDAMAVDGSDVQELRE